MMTTGRESKKATRTSDEGEEMKIEAESVAKMEDMNDATMAASGTLQAEASFTFQVLKIAVKKYCFVKRSLSKVMEDLHEPETGLALLQKVSLVLADFQYSTRSAQGQTSFALDVFFKKDVKHKVRFLGNLVSRGAHGQSFCLHPMFLH